MNTRRSKTSWSLAGAVIASVAASICCLGPLVLLALGVGGAGVSRLSVLEPYRPIFIAVTLGLLGFAFYRAYRAPAATCETDDSCSIPRATRINRIALWITTPLVLAMVAFPKVAPRLFGQRNSSPAKGQPMSADCCQVGSNASPQKSDAPPQLISTTQRVNAAHELLFKVAQLRCPLVIGVGCGHLLAPTMAQVNRIEGVSQSYSNWTGTILRISARPGADRDAVAERVLAFLAADGQDPGRVEGAEVATSLRNEDWRDLSRITDLSSYEFKTVAKRRINAFADNEKLDSTQREKLLNFVDGLWDKSGVGLGSPRLDAAEYAAYWQNRREKFVAAYLERARELLTPEQAQRLVRDYGPHTNSPQ